MKDDSAPSPAPKPFERRTAQALVATFLQMSRSANLAHWLHQARQRSLERRVRATNDMKDLVRLQRRLDTQQAQAVVIQAAAERFRHRAPALAQFAKAGLTMDDFQKMGVGHVVDVDKFSAEVARVRSEAAAAAGPAAPTDSPATHGTHGHGAHRKKPTHSGEASAGKPAAHKKKATAKRRPPSKG
jgi:hypothetical protein